MHRDDPPTAKALALTLEAHVRAHRGEAWLKLRARASDEDEDELERCEELEALARATLEHLDAGRWDEAQACGEEVLSLAEAARAGEIWREFGLLVEEAAETGRASADVLELR